ncbi:MAG: ribonucleoside-diphosphate reductase [Actinomycetia bacterium]|nr:ribonucleoside-diphosphate reductase [Actinomycetes bacterium]
MAMAPNRQELGFRRHFTIAGISPHDEMDWETRDARLTDWRTGETTFEQVGVQFPAGWSINATNIVSQKYFRGTLGTPEREASLRQVVDRVADTISGWGASDGYFTDTEEAATFTDELKWLLLHQRMAFNSPVWFNIGVEGVPQQASACFILSVDDTMEDILNWYVEEGRIFQGGSGSGVNLSRIRSSKETIKGGGEASGPVSFMRGADASAGTIKSGGKTRRAAKMVVLDADHPDIEDFIWCKAREEHKARVLRDAGFDMDLDGADSASIQYQNANNSVRVSDEFMQAVENDDVWELTARTSGDVLETVRARDVFRAIAEAAWECADPGLQYDTTINRWHTTPNAGRINASNPCFTGETLVHTDRGLISFSELANRVNNGEQFRVWTHDITGEHPEPQAVLTSPDALLITGFNPIVRLEFDRGHVVRCTPQHRFFTHNRGWVEAGELTSGDAVALLDTEAPSVAADWSIPIASDTNFYDETANKPDSVHLPEEWSDTFAHYLGWVVADDSMSRFTACTTYDADHRFEILPRHQLLIEEINGGRALKPSVQGDGTVQLRMGRRVFRRFLETLGVAAVTATHKTIPWSIQQAPTEVVAAFLRGLYDADGWVCVDQEQEHHVGLSSISVDLLRGVQQLLTTFGISSHIHQVGSAGQESLGPDASEADGAVASFDLRVTDADIEVFAGVIGFELSAKVAALDEVVSTRVGAPHTATRVAELRSRIDDGIELTYTLSEPRNHSYIVNGLVVRNCSEYVHVDNSSCNLASLNLLSFLDEVDDFDVAGFQQAVSLTFTAMDILVGHADYPTESIGDNSRRYRQLGLGYTNLGAVLMALGLPYDSDEGRAFAGAITALMGGTAYSTSGLVAARMGAFGAFDGDADNVINVLRMHRDAVNGIDEEKVDLDLLGSAQKVWDQAVERAECHGVRNAQATVLAPTGTISFMMDCDTTGIEPDLGLVKFKKLVGGGTMSIINQTTSRALRRLGYSETQIVEIESHILATSSIVGAPGLDAGDLPVFACSMGDNVIHHGGHIKMMAAVQPFLSGAISKTVNLPESATVEEIEQLHLAAWKLGLKAVAVYRDNCKIGQPLSTTRDDNKKQDQQEVAAVLPVVDLAPRAPERERLPRRRSSRTYSFRVADCHGYMTVGEYDDGRPGEIFLTVAKQGSTLAGIMDAFAISVSHGLQYGVPLQSYVEAYTNLRFEPAGITDDPELRIATSLVDYIFRRLALEYLPYDNRAGLGILTTEERIEPTLPGMETAAVPSSGVSGVGSVTVGSSGDRVEEDLIAAATSPEVPYQSEPSPSASINRRTGDAPLCFTCGDVMARAGSCYTCRSCGSTSGCS